MIHRSRLAPVAVGIVVAVLVSGVVRQLARPYLEHDDWDFLLPVQPARTTVMLHRVLTEGRWFSYTWWRVVGHVLSPTLASLLFAVGVLALAAVVGRRWASGWLVVPAVVALALCPMFADLSYWPATLGSSMVVLAVAAALLPAYVENPRRRAAWLVLSTLVVFLAYPPSTLVLLVLLAVELLDRPWRDLAVAVLTYGAAYAGSTLLAFTLNAVTFGHFGVEPLAWRRPNPVHGLGDLVENVGRAFGQLHGLVAGFTVPVTVGALALLALVVITDLRAHGLRLVAVLVVGLGVQGAPTVLTGVTTPVRSMGWVWFVVVLVLVHLVEEVRTDAPSTGRLERWVPVGALVALVAVCAWGARYSLREVDHNQHRREVMERVLDSLARTAAAHPGDRVVVLGTEADWGSSAFRAQAQYLGGKARYDHGIVVTNCVPPVCDLAVRRPGVVARAERGARSFASGSLVIVVPPAYGEATGS